MSSCPIQDHHTSGSRTHAWAQEEERPNTTAVCLCSINMGLFIDDSQHKQLSALFPPLYRSGEIVQCCQGGDSRSQTPNLAQCSCTDQKVSIEAFGTHMSLRWGGRAPAQAPEGDSQFCTVLPSSHKPSQIVVQVYHAIHLMVLPQNPPVGPWGHHCRPISSDCPTW